MVPSSAAAVHLLRRRGRDDARLGRDQGDAFIGDWSKLIVGVRQDVTFDLSTDGVLLNTDGTIAVSAFQDDLALMRCYIRVGVVLGTPVKADNTGPTKRFSAAKWAGVTPSSARASSK
jgi:hypothetical protein